MRSGTAVALAFGAVLVLGVLVVGLYKLREHGQPPETVTFQHVDAAPANATVHPLDFLAVHQRDSFLQDHLDTALQHGSSSEGDRLRVEQMRATLDELASRDAMLYVDWQGAVVLVQFSGL